MPLPPIVTTWQNKSERWAARRCAELGLPYKQLWKLTPEVAQQHDPQFLEVLLQWAEMNPFERCHWGQVYPELELVPHELLNQECDRLRRMRDNELELRMRGRIRKTEPTPPAAEPEEFRLTSAGEVAEAKKRKRKKAS